MIHISLKQPQSIGISLKQPSSIPISFNGSSSGGTIVIPNPSSEQTDDLETVKINSDTFRIKDPQLSDWARGESKPSYTAEEVGAVDADNELAYAEIDRMFNAVFGI